MGHTALILHKGTQGLSLTPPEKECVCVCVCVCVCASVCEWMCLYFLECHPFTAVYIFQHCGQFVDCTRFLSISHSFPMVGHF